jgi:hypothetical protein
MENNNCCSLCKQKLNTIKFEGGSLLDAFNKVKLDYREEAKKILYDYGQYNIRSITAVRTPILTPINKLLNIISLNKLQTLKDKYNIDTLYHLGIIVDLYEPNKKFVIEKNEKITISAYKSSYIKKNSQTVSVDLKQKKLSLLDLLNNARQKYTDKTFFEYDGTGKNGRTNNCQDFIIMLLNASGINEPNIHNFIKQDLDQLLQKMSPTFHNIIKKTTDIANKATQIIGLGKIKINAELLEAE